MRSSSMDDFSLVRKCIEGDTETYRHIINRYKDLIARVIYSIIDSTADIEDLTQEVFIKAYKSLPRFKFDSSLKTWLYRIAVNHAIDHVRKKRLARIVSLDAIDEWLFGRMRGLGYAREKLPEDITRAEVKELVNWALEKLSTDAKTIIILRELEGMHYEDIASVLNISVPAVKSRLFRARAELKKILTPAIRGDI
jgi:RNA polymerase sigma-70 factor, ECF subfamily